MFALTFRSVFATLKGPLFALLDHSLLEYRRRVGRLHPFRLPAEPIGVDLQDVVDSLHILQKLHCSRNYRPVTETLEMLLRETRAHLAFALRPSGEQVLANVLHIAELARKYEANGGLWFRGFVEELGFGGDAIETGEAPIFEEGSEGIRMMSVHQAKRLEFPIVILADITANLCLPRPNRHIDSSRSLCAVWRAECAYNQPDDYVFASIKMYGKQPIWPNSAMEDHIRPAAKEPGLRNGSAGIRSDTRSVRCSKRTVKMWRRCKH